MKKRKGSKTTKLEKKVFDEIREEAVDEVKHPGPNNGKTYGIFALIFALIGFLFLFLFVPLAIIGGVFGFIFAIKAERRGYKKLGKFAATVSFIDILALIIAFALILSNHTASGLTPLDPSTIFNIWKL